MTLDLGELPAKAISVVAGVGRGGDRSVAVDLHEYNLKRGGVETIPHMLEMVERDGLLWWPMEQLDEIIAGVIARTSVGTPLSWLGPGADVYASGCALHYRSLQDGELFREIQEIVSRQEIYRLQGAAAAQFFQAVVQCYALNKARVLPSYVRMLCDTITCRICGNSVLAGRSRSMARSNGIDAQGAAELFARLGLTDWYDSLTAIPYFEPDVLVTGTSGCRMIPCGHDSLPTRLGAAEAESDAEDGSGDEGPSIAVFGTGGWSMVSLRLPDGKPTGQEDMDKLFALNAAQEGIGPQACWVRNTIMSGIYGQVRDLTGWNYEQAAEQAGQHLPWAGDDLEVRDGVIICQGAPATAQSLADTFNDNSRALAFLIWKTAGSLVADLHDLAAATGIKLEGSVALTGGFSNNSVFVELVREMLVEFGLGVRLPRHRGHMTEDAGLADVLRCMLHIPFPAALSMVHRVRDGMPAQV